MDLLVEQVDKALIDLAWSLWSELGVAGVDKQHQNSLIALEELIILTAVVADSDPRLRDEALDWCFKYHHFISVCRLKTLVKALPEEVHQSFSLFSSTLNSIAQTKWPTFTAVSPLQISLSGKSVLPSFEAPALLSLRLRAMFGVGIRADLLTFCLTQSTNHFSAIDTVKIGYSKRSLSEALDSFAKSGLLTDSMVGNRRVYALAKRNELSVFIGSLPKIAPDWSVIINFFISLRSALKASQSFSTSSKAITVRNFLNQMKNDLKILNLSPPHLSDGINEYWDSFGKWLLNTLREAVQGHFWGRFHVNSVENMDKQVGSLMQHLYAVEDCLDGLEFVMSFALQDPHRHEEIFRENYKHAISFLSDLLKSMKALFKFPIYSLFDVNLVEIILKFEKEEFISVEEGIGKFLATSMVSTSSCALNQYQDLEKIINKFRSFIFKFTEQLKRVYLHKMDAHLLTLSPKLYKRHEIMRLFRFLD